MNDMTYLKKKTTKRELFHTICPYLAGVMFFVAMMLGMIQNQIYTTPEPIIPRDVGGIYTIVFVLMAIAFISIPFLIGFYMGWNHNDANGYAKYGNVPIQDDGSITSE